MFCTPSRRGSKKGARTASVLTRTGYSSSGLLLFCTLLLLASFLTGCSAVDNRIRERQAEFDSYPPDVQALIKNGQIRTGFTQTQVYIAWGEPYYRGGSQRTYPGYDCQKFQVPKDEYEFRRQYEDEWEEYQKKKQKGDKAIFVPPARYKEESRCRRYIKDYLYFDGSILKRIDSPPTITWIDADWDYKR